MVTDQQIASWREALRGAAGFGTPFYALWSRPFSQAVHRARSATATIAKARHWYSYKSQPVPSLARLALEMGMGMEVVSPFELNAAQRLGFEASNTLINGVAKHHWLRESSRELNVIFDSLSEIDNLVSKAQLLGWRCGLRVAVSQQINADAPQLPAQFGMNRSEVGRAAEVLKAKGLSVDILHFHLRSNVPSTSEYEAALLELSDLALAHDLKPRIIDVGGGLPDVMLPHQAGATTTPSIDGLGRVAAAACQAFPNAEEIWFENGRALLAPAGVLVVTILDIKERDGYRILICDGGRTNHALPSDWEAHNTALVRPPLGDNQRPTLICGPTCMAFDSLYQGPFATDAEIGDRIIYFNAGAYHIPWETRFSFGTSRVLWISDGGQVREIRNAESADEWFTRWIDP